MTNTTFNTTSPPLVFFQPHGRNQGYRSDTLSKHISDLRSEFPKARNFECPFYCEPNGDQILVFAYRQPVGVLVGTVVSPSYLEYCLNRPE
jgi:hypothetical protein